MPDRARSRSPLPPRAGSCGSKGKGQGGKSVFEIMWPVYRQVKSFRTEAQRLEEEMARQARHLQKLEDLIEEIWGCS